MKILLANPPWAIGSCRAGSRWAHRNECKESSLLDRIILYLESPPKRKSLSYRTFPLFMAQAAAMLEQSGFHVKVIDSITTDQPREEFVKDVMKYSPDMLVFETSTTSFKNDIELLREVRNSLPCKTVMCGPHVSALPEEALIHDFLDYVCIGEYEQTLVNLAERLSKDKDFKDLKGIAFREKGKIIANPRQPLIEDLDSLPSPAYHLMPMEKYWTPYSKTDTSIEIMATRGCPFKCTYCVFPQIFYNSPKVRYRSPKKVVDEIDMLLKEYNKQGIYFNDDTFTLRKPYVLDICREIKERGLKFPWGCFGRVDTVDREMLETMKDAGCIMIKYGVESGSQEILDNVRKGYTLDKVRKAFKLTKDVGIGTHGTFMVGLPGETPDTIRETLSFAKEINPDSTVWALLTPFPGTKLYFDAKEKGWIEITDWEKYDGGNYAVMRTEAMSVRDIEKAWEFIKNEWDIYRQKRKSQIKNFFYSTYKERGLAMIPVRISAKMIILVNEFIKRSKHKVS